MRVRVRVVLQRVCPGVESSLGASDKVLPAKEGRRLLYLHMLKNGISVAGSRRRLLVHPPACTCIQYGGCVYRYKCDMQVSVTHAVAEGPAALAAAATVAVAIAALQLVSPHIPSKETDQLDAPNFHTTTTVLPHFSPRVLHTALLGCLKAPPPVATDFSALLPDSSSQRRYMLLQTIHCPAGPTQLGASRPSLFSRRIRVDLITRPSRCCHSTPSGPMSSIDYFVRMSR